MPRPTPKPEKGLVDTLFDYTTWIQVSMPFASIAFLKGA